MFFINNQRHMSYGIHQIYANASSYTIS